MSGCGHERRVNRVEFQLRHWKQLLLYHHGQSRPRSIGIICALQLLLMCRLSILHASTHFQRKAVGLLCGSVDL